jgi:hypothetical protein
MATDGETDENDPPSEDETAVLGAFVDVAPRTAAEVAAETDLDPEAARAALDTLVERGALDRKQVSGVDVGARERPMADEREELTVDLWYLAADRLEGGDVVVTLDADRPVEEALDEMEFPGASEMMRDWRRDAVHEAYEYLREQGPATRETLIDAVYPPHSAGYADADAWFDCVGPRLAELPGVERDDGEFRL